jgi:hypothetical protein
MLQLIKYTLTLIGKRLSAETVRKLNAIVNYLEVGRWMQAGGYDVTHRCESREELFDIVAAQIAHCEVLYLEFGVFTGDATRYWSKLLRNPKSKLHGFDSFEGLPQDWLAHRPRGYFSLQGEIPQIDDDRVHFFKGWFEQTLPNYELPSHGVLVVNFDADLYSSTIFVLNALEPAMVRGTYVYFDEFNHQFDELRAFDEFIKRTGMRFKVVGLTRTLDHVMFQRTS